MENKQLDEIVRLIQQKAEKEKRIKEEYERIVELKKTYTGREIAKMLGISPSSVSAKINRYEKKKAIENGPSKVPLTIDFKNKTITL
ncbi:winged helix-turn-helix transcriptional regulator [Clostridium butyricum]|uniref:winged helix-turn-helix transcriptional regulator n=1 Tax=Clostridium butyricum TaxID=1492 RepID=UPI00041F8FEC|nr:helix-turn-helix domain-containing protein [Clostridium butyricum]